MSHNRWNLWQEREGGPLVKPSCNTHPWYNLAAWRKGFRPAALRRHPICEQCQWNAATIVDHVIPFIDAKGIVSWALFSSPENHKAECVPCHSTLTASYDGGFGNARKAGKETHRQPTGEAGRQFIASSISVQKVNAALPQSQKEIDDLLEGIPD